MTHTRISWVEFRKVPLRCWMKSFFLKMGRVFGEALMVDEITIQKRILDKGRVLVCLPLDGYFPDEIEVDEYGKVVPGKLVLEKRKETSKVGIVDEDNSTSSDTEEDFWSRKDLCEGECSLKNAGGTIKEVQLDLLDSDKGPNMSPIDIVNRPMGGSCPRLNECAARDFWIDIGPALGSEISVSKSINS
ncbi:hypothetical protein Dsin_032614 [Dipteronia sinensis]|uniref:DUF4283 domain-containing protein n=1 Tax=Dipteronia sinensis TaxID=43782 RepID=A0AAE0DMZ2_9ROSI|nr:hypothetical protein Dsin_032614 [Dipteronia sinensis]